MHNLRTVGVIMVLLAAVISKPRFDVKVLSPSAIDIACVFNDTSTQITEFSRRTDTQFKSIVEVVQKNCNVTNQFRSSLTQCFCLDNCVTCNISNIESSEENAQWMCTIVMFSIRLHSDIVNVNIRGTSTNAALADYSMSETTTVLKTPKTNRESTHTKNEVTTSLTKIDEVSTANSHINLMTSANMSTNIINKTYVSEIVLATAGPFILFDIALVICIYRRKLRLCQKRKTEVDNAILTGCVLSVETGNDTSDLHINAFGSVASSNPTSDNTNTAHYAHSLSGPKGRLHGLDPYDDDPIYSFAKETDTRCPEEGACGNSVNTYSKEPIADDILDEDPLCMTIINDKPHYKTVQKNVPFYSKNNTYSTISKGDPFYPTVNKDSKPAMKKYDPHYATLNKLGKCSVTENFDHPCYSDDKSYYATVNNEDDDDDPLYSNVKMDGPLHTSVNQENQDQTLIKEEPVCAPVKYTGPLDSSESKDDPINSVVNKNKVRGKLTVNAVNTLASLIASPQDYPYSVVNNRQEMA